MDRVLKDSVTGKEVLESEMKKKYKSGLIDIKIERMAGERCPRCYNYEGVEDNFMQICDRCCKFLLDGADDLVDMGRLSIQERDMMVEGIKSAQLAQIQKYRK